MQISRELAEIGRLINSAAFLVEIRNEVAKLRKGSFVVMDGKHYPPATNYEVVVKCGGDIGDIARRIRANIPGSRVDKIADDVLGISASRRGR